MRSPILRLLTTLVILAAFAAGVAYHQADIEGHWHVVRHTENAFSEMVTFDVGPEPEWEGFDQVLSINNFALNGFGWGGGVDRWRRSITILPTCFNMHVTYRRLGDSLFVQEVDYNGNPTGEEAVAFRCREACCDPQRDRFFNSGLQIDLPIRDDRKQELEAYAERIDFIYLVFGRNHADEWTVSNFNGRSLPDDLTLFIESHEVKMPEKRRPAMALRLFADKDTPTAFLQQTIDQFRALRPEIKVERVYREEVIERPMQLWTNRSVDL